MRSNLPLLALSAFIIAYGAPVLAADTSSSAKSETTMERDDNGGYTKSTTTQKEDASGTLTKDETKEKVTKDSDGNMERKIQSKSTIDPKGLFNKQTESTTDDTVVKSDGTKKHSVKTSVNGTTVEENTSNSQPAK